MKEILSHWIIWVIVCIAVNLIANPIVNRFNNDSMLSMYFSQMKPSSSFEYLAKFLVVVQAIVSFTTFLSILFCFTMALK